MAGNVTMRGVMVGCSRRRDVRRFRVTGATFFARAKIPWVCRDYAIHILPWRCVCVAAYSCSFLSLLLDLDK